MDFIVNVVWSEVGFRCVVFCGCGLGVFNCIFNGFGVCIGFGGFGFVWYDEDLGNVIR